MTDVRKVANALVILLTALPVVACNKKTEPEQDRKVTTGPVGAAPDAQVRKGVDESPEHEIVTSLDAEYELEPARTTAGDLVATAWQEAKAEPAAGLPPKSTGDGKTAPTQPNPAAGKPGPDGKPADQGTPTPPPPPKTPRTWLVPAVLVGRTHLFAAGKPIAAVACKADPQTLCDAAGLRGPTGKQALDLDPTALAALTTAAQANGWSGKEVLVLMDRRVAWSAIEAVQTTLRAAGAQPVLTAATYAGQLARILPPAGTVATPEPANSPGTPPSQVGGESTNQPDAVPDDVQGVTVGVTAHGITLLLTRKQGEPVQPELLGNVLESLAAWAERLHTAAPSVSEVTISIEPAAPVEEVVRAIDALRDTCARVAKGTPCHDRRVLYPRLLLVRAGTAAPATAPEAATPTEGQAEPPGLILGNPSMHLDVPEGGAPPLGAGAMHLDRGPAGVIDRDRPSLGLTAPPSLQRPATAPPSTAPRAP